MRLFLPVIYLFVVVRSKEMAGLVKNPRDPGVAWEDENQIINTSKIPLYEEITDSWSQCSNAGCGVPPTQLNGWPQALGCPLGEY